MRIVLYEDHPEEFFPIVNFYPQFNLRIGMRTIAENTAYYFPKFRLDYIARPLFNFKFNPRNEPTIYLSSRLILNERIQLPYEETRFVVDGNDAGFLKVTPPFPQSLDEITPALNNIKRRKDISGRFIKYPWDLIRYNKDMIIEHFKQIKKPCMISRSITFTGSKRSIFIARDAMVHKFVYFDCTEGPVYIDRKVEIKPFTTIIGPSFIGEGTILDRAKVIKSTIGPYCRIGGEVEECIFQGFSNKYHEGFIGHSFIGEWVNIGSLTTNSDLKNNYSNVRIKLGDREYDTGMIKLGCFIGDHTKLGIGTLIPTGAVVGSFVNFFGGGMMPKYVPSFKWLGPNIEEDYKLEKAIAMTRVVMARRGITLSPEYEELIRYNHKNR
jgi:UDP-N-acetylglucosamine diphosphorylase/glucosamine-1-phosphate N-acetyltransferase|uniref:Glucose-1-phosphate thymidylyltransferase n=1 Tax=candidate division WOR-3 bacterium TaxID=2052148 RepID=A0A7V3RFU5_UNCW3